MFLFAIFLAYPIQLFQYAIEALTIVLGGPVYLVAQLVESISSLF